MASKKKTPKAPAYSTPYDNYFEMLAGDKKGEIYKGFQAGYGLGNEWFSPGSMGRLDSQLPQDLVDTGAALRKQYEDSLQTSADLEGSVDNLKNLAATAGTRSKETQDVLDRRIAALSGMSQPETQARKDSALVDMNTGLSTALRGLRARFPGANGPAGQLAATPAIAQYASQTRGLGRDLIAQDAEMRRQALEGYSGDVRNFQNDEYQQRLLAQQAYNQAAGQRDEFLANRRGQALGQLSNYGQAMDQRNLGVQQYNLGQANAERAGLYGSVLGGGQFGAARLGADRAYELGKKAIAAAAAAEAPSAEALTPSIPSGFYTGTSYSPSAGAGWQNTSNYGNQVASSYPARGAYYDSTTGRWLV